MLNAAISAVTFGTPTSITFAVTDGAGRGAIGLRAGSSGNVRVALAKLVPGPEPADPTRWQSMVNRAAGTPPGQVMQATNERTGTLTDNLDGTYTYTLATDLSDARNPVTGELIPFEATRTHRVVLQISGAVNGNTLPAINAVLDVVPAGGTVTETRNIIESKSCNECHGRIVAHGSRYEAGYCVVCHNVNTAIPGATLPLADMSYMTHAIHGASFRAANGAAPFLLGGEDFSETTYPQDLKHCNKCHEASTAAPQGDNWQVTPNVISCGGCHEGPTYAAHTADPASALCNTCHVQGLISTCGPANNQSCRIVDVHRTVNPTQNNEALPPGVDRIDYAIDSVTVGSLGEAVIRFKILRNGTAIDLSVNPATLGLSGGPSFLLAWANAQDGIDAPIDYNNLGSGQAGSQPSTVSLANLRNAVAGPTGGTLSAADSEGFHTATTNFVFPPGSVMRTVSLQGYFTQLGVPLLGNVDRHTVSRVETVAGDVPRRTVADPAKCSNCHEWFEAHGGNRVYEVQVCVTCHNPNLTSSGRTASTPVSGPVQTQIGAALSSGVLPTNPLVSGPLDPANPLTWPEAPQNFKDMIHSIHSAGVRNNVFDFVRVRGSSVTGYNFSEITYPSDINNCETCHMPGSYDTNLPPGELASTQLVPSGTPDSRAAIIAARGSLPNGDDIVTTPAAAACVSCHDGVQAVNHMRLNGALVNAPRSQLATGNLETCNVCHGAGRTADAVTAHSGL